ncbi:hypothetical protein SADUNF_Sadunf13G0037100 [Salix dunnii]|uniref:Isopenicillin N synthase-like Fe(2+) 2OG dioxygenase domain-containing protein n=1 Tax=Salix dunnii TaxID=1413687 RepID=A0A835JIP8_9ROSI|nr:hypothetical protein SADUNF_Sadunf13G0037100 [Salix dunnii]
MLMKLLLILAVKLFSFTYCREIAIKHSAYIERLGGTLLELHLDSSDHIGGLQVFHQDHWVDVPSTAGAFVVNIGDLLQIISIGKFKSSEHLSIGFWLITWGPRISVASFFAIYGRVCAPTERAEIR